MTKTRIISLRFWLPFLVFGAFSLMALVFTLSIQQSYEDDLFASSQDYIKQDMSELSRDMLEQLLIKDLRQADRLLTRKASRRSYSLLVAINDNAEIYSSTNKALLNTSAVETIDGFEPDHLAQVITDNQEHFHVDRPQHKIVAYFPIKSVRTPYSDDEQQFGALYLEFDLTLAINQLWENTWETVRIALLTTLLFILLFYALLNRFINRPLDQLTAVTRSITGGELGTTSNMSGQGEFSELNEAINTMSQQLKTNIEKLEANEKQIQEILWASRVGTWVYDIKTGEFKVNKRWKEILGYDDEELTLRTIEDWKSLIHPDDRQRVIDALEDKLSGKSKRFREIEMRLATKQHDWLWIKSRGRAVEKDADDKVLRMSGIITDISKRRKAEAEMHIRDRSIEKFNVGVIITDASQPDYPIIYCNEYIERITGYREDELIGKNCRLFQQNDRQQKGLDIIRHALQNNIECKVQLRNYKKDGTLFWNELTLSPVFNEYNTLTNYIASLSDITDTKLAEERLNILRRAMEATDSPMIILDRGKMIEYVNPAYIKELGYTEQELVGRNHGFLRSDKVTTDQYEKIWSYVVDSGIWKGTFQNKRKNGDLFRDKCTISAVTDAYGEATHFICIHEDVTREHELNQQLSYEATHDKLTGLINRAEFERRASRLLESIVDHSEEHAMCFMDLDQFKVINDSCGHSAGDELLRQIGTVLQSVTRKRDTVARLGGDEFAVLMEHCTIEQAHRVANDILNTIQDFNFIWDERSFKLGMSIGLVKIDKDVSTLEQLLKQGDTACYMAKDLGRNRIHIYYTNDNEIARREGQTQWVERIYQALEKDRFCLFAQPIMNTSTGISDHYELLLRMVDDDSNTIPPGAFLPAAERYNIISKIDEWVIDHVIKLLTKNDAFLEKIDCLSINLSGQSLGNSGFIKHISGLLKNSGVNTRKICFEITETSAISNLHVASEFIQQMRQLGCRFSLDDFGSGLSSFAYLKQLPVDFLKIDGLFVKDIARDRIDLAMVRSMNEIGNVMGMQTIAEFVENDEILGLLKEIGVDYVQGYGIARPKPLEDILKDLNNADNSNVIQFKN